MLPSSPSHHRPGIQPISPGNTNGNSWMPQAPRLALMAFILLVGGGNIRSDSIRTPNEPDTNAPAAPSDPPPTATPVASAPDAPPLSRVIENGEPYQVRTLEYDIHGKTFEALFQIRVTRSSGRRNMADIVEIELHKISGGPQGGIHRAHVILDHTGRMRDGSSVSHIEGDKVVTRFFYALGHPMTQDLRYTLRELHRNGTFGILKDTRSETIMAAFAGRN